MSGSSAAERENVPILVLTRQRDSHPFQERNIVLNDVIKVGRSVGKFKPSSTNAIFDCKVLSRSHALIWFKNGRFILRDTNSSNGTFVNNTRVSKKNDEEYAEREIFSGDVIRFGVDVVEHDTTHGCIIAQVTLLYPTGVEAKPSVEHVMGTNGVIGTEVFPTEQVFKLAHYISEALFREQILEEKLESINRLLEETRQMSEAGWQAMIDEERLLEKLDLYESQLSLLKKDLPQDTLQSRLHQVLEEKFNLEKASKIMLERVLNEKTEALSKATELECCLADSEQECARLRQDCETTQEAYQSIANDFQTKVSELERLEQQLKEVDSMKHQLESQLAEKTKEAELLQADVSSSATNKLPNLSDDLGKKLISSVNGLDIVLPQNSEQIDEKVNTTEQLQTCLTQRADLMRDELALAELNELDRFCDIQERLATSEADLEHMLDSTSDGISMHLNDSIRQFNQSMQLIKSLQDELKLLSRLKSSLFRDVVESPTTVSKNMMEDKIENSIESSQVDDSSSPVEKHDDLESKDFCAALARAQKLTMLVAACQTRAEANLTSLVAQQKQKKPTGATCNTSGDVCAPVFTRPNTSTEDLNKDFSVTPAVPVSVHTSPSTQASTPNRYSSVALQASFETEEQFKLREDLQVAVNELDVYKQLSEDLKKQDASKSELLLSVREECDVLRNRIASIESDVTTSRIDHQRLAAEAKRARTETEDLRGERKTLTEQISACNLEIERLKSLLSTVQNVQQAETIVQTQDGVKSQLGSPPSFSTAVSEERGKLIMSTYSQSTLNPLSTRGSMFPLFIIIPVMVLLCAIMMYIFSKLSR